VPDKPYIAIPPLIVRRAHRLIAANFHPEERITTKELATWLGVSEQMLEINRHNGVGPTYERVGPKAIRYRIGTVLTYLKSTQHKSTSEYDTVERHRMKRAAGK
jgi:hypothetical protein